MTTTTDNNRPHESDIASSVLLRIEKEAIAPAPRWHYLFHEWVVWSIGGVAVVLGALSVAAIIFTGSYSDWEYFEATHDSIISFALDVMPYTWIVMLGLFGAAAYVSVRHTKRGYRYSIPVLLVGAIGASVLGGSALYGAGAGRFVDEEIGSVIPLHRSLQETKLAFWNQPERGIIAGVVEEISEEGTLTLLTPQGEETVSVATLDEDTRSELEVGSTVRMVAPRPLSATPSRYMGAAKGGVMMDDPAARSYRASEMSSDSALAVPPPEATVESEIALPAPREACLVLPLDWDRGYDKDEKNNKKEKKREERRLDPECLRELRDARGER